MQAFGEHLIDNSPVNQQELINELFYYKNSITTYGPKVVF